MGEKEYAKIIAKNLRNWMLKRDVTQADLCRDLDLSKTTVSSWMNGVRTPRMSKIDMLCDYLGCSRADLMEPTREEYYLNHETARLAQEMFDDPDVKAFFHMKRTMDPDVFSSHFRFMKEAYRREHPEDDTGC